MFNLRGPWDEAVCLFRHSGSLLVDERGNQSSAKFSIGIGLGRHSDFLGSMIVLYDGECFVGRENVLCEEKIDELFRAEVGCSKPSRFVDLW